MSQRTPAQKRHEEEEGALLAPGGDAVLPGAVSKAQRAGAAGSAVQGQRFRAVAGGPARSRFREVLASVPAKTEKAESRVQAIGPGYDVLPRDGTAVQEPRANGPVDFRRARRPRERILVRSRRQNQDGVGKFGFW